MSPPDVVSLLAGLGDRPSEVATALEQMGHRGVCRSTSACVLVRYLEAHGLRDAFLCPMQGLRWAGGWLDHSSLGQTICQFAVQFDDGCYPDLIERGAA